MQEDIASAGGWSASVSSGRCDGWGSGRVGMGERQEGAPGPEATIEPSPSSTPYDQVVRKLRKRAQALLHDVQVVSPPPPPPRPSLDGCTMVTVRVLFELFGLTSVNVTPI